MASSIKNVAPCYYIYIFLVIVDAQNNVLDCECGVREDVDVGHRIINGREARPHAYPWTIFLKYQGKPYCGGTIINNFYILTAAHCVYSLRQNAIQVVAGAHQLTGDGTTYKIDNYLIHPNYKRHTDYDNNDLALIKVSQELRFDDKVNPVCLPQALSYTDTTAMISGWGRTTKNKMSSKLMHSFVRVLHDQQCINSKKIGNKFVTLQNMCAYGSRTDTCQGDSGSGLTYQSDPYKHQIIGIVSWGEGCATEGIPGVYVRVSSYLRWIIQNTKDAQYCHIYQ